MPRIVLDGPADFDGWRKAARRLSMEGVAPEQVHWIVGDGEPGLFEGDDPATARPPASASTFNVPRAFVDLAEHAALHSDPERFALLYRLLWRLRRETRLMQLMSDADIVRISDLAKNVRRDIHKMHAYVRFRMVTQESEEHYVAWYEPAHHVVEAASPFFMRRFANLRWSILTPECSAIWDGETLRFGPGAGKQDAPQEDVLEELWRDYYANIFNPARVNPKVMQGEMPKRFWKNLPEASLIEPLIRGAHQKTREMVEKAPMAPAIRRGAVAQQAAQQPPSRDGAEAATIEAIRAEAAACKACPLWEPATQTVFGEGPVTARVVLVGEQPGDQEDLAGRPFVGPAGQLLDRALTEAGIDRRRLYVTNAVKHFKFMLRGKRRIHQKPDTTDIRVCSPWLARELEAIGPTHIVAMGATAVQAVFGHALPITRNRGRMMPLEASSGSLLLQPPRTGLITVHPSYLLRLPDAASKEREYKFFVEDLSQIRQFL